MATNVTRGRLDIHGFLHDRPRPGAHICARWPGMPSSSACQVFTYACGDGRGRGEWELCKVDSMSYMSPLAWASAVAVLRGSSAHGVDLSQRRSLALSVSAWSARLKFP